MNPARIADAQPEAQERRAALVVHALAPTDREWMLKRLPPDQRERMQQMLAELQTLGIPASRNVLNDAVGQTPALAQPVAPIVTAPRDVKPATPLDALKAADASVLAAMLRHEPAGLVARLLHAHAWTWSAALRAQLGQARCNEIDIALEQLRRERPADAAPALNQALLAAVAVRLAAQPGAIAVAASPRPRPNWRAYVPRWVPLARVAG